jgi:hypothetical protein
MSVREIEAFARSLMREVWEAFDPEAVPRFYHRDVIGHHRAQTLNYNDILNRLAWDRKHNAAPVFVIQDLIAPQDRLRSAFCVLLYRLAPTVLDAVTTRAA